MASRPGRAGRGAGIGLRRARDRRAVAAGHGVRGAPLRRAAGDRASRWPRPASRCSRFLTWLVLAPASGLGDAPRCERAVRDHQPRPRGDHAPAGAGRLTVINLVQTHERPMDPPLRPRHRRLRRGLAGLPARGEPARRDRLPALGERLRGRDRLGARRVRVGRLRHVHVRRLRAGRSRACLGSCADPGTAASCPPRSCGWGSAARRSPAWR